MVRERGQRSRIPEFHHLHMHPEVLIAQLANWTMSFCKSVFSLLLSFLLKRLRNRKSSDMITVLVGEKRVAFGIHITLLVAYSPVMTARLQAVVASQAPKVVMLPNDDPDIFSYLTYWMHEARFPRIDSFAQSCIDKGSDPFGILIRRSTP